MTKTDMQTKRLQLVLQSPEETRAQLERMTLAERAQVSPVWLARVQAATSSDPWTHGFVLVQRTDGTTVGSAGFKGPPTTDGVVEVAYAVHEAHQNQGYATEAADAMATYAFQSGQVRVVRAHTLSDANASARVLLKCGFRRIGEVMDPEDGLVWRWERYHEPAAQAQPPA